MMLMMELTVRKRLGVYVAKERADADLEIHLLAVGLYEKGSSNMQLTDNELMSCN